MTSTEPLDTDICRCGDERKDHKDGKGLCSMPNDLTHGFKPCKRFRFSCKAPHLESVLKAATPPRSFTWGQEIMRLKEENDRLRNACKFAQDVLQDNLKAWSYKNEVTMLEAFNRCKDALRKRRKAKAS